MWCVKVQTMGNTQIPLDPPFSKGEVSLHDFNPSLEKSDRGDFWAEWGELCHEFLDRMLLETMISTV